MRGLRYIAFASHAIAAFGLPADPFDVESTSNTSVRTGGIGSRGNNVNFYDDIVLVELQPVEYVCEDITSTSTISRTVTTSFAAVTTPYSGSEVVTSIVLPCGTSPGSIIVFTPYEDKTAASYTGNGKPTNPSAWTSIGTSTVAIPPSGTASGTAVVEVPPPDYVTTTSTWTGTGTSTVTIPPSSTAPGTVIVEVPPGYITTTRTWMGNGTSTVTIPPSGTSPGTVIVDVPFVFYITTTAPWTGTDTTTTTIMPSGTNPGTVIVETPDSYVTTTSPWTGTGTTTITVPPSGTNPGTVIVETPDSYVTTTEPWTGTDTTTTTIMPSGTNPGTVIVETPDSYVTTTEPWTGSGSTTVTVPPSGTNPGTVIVETPDSYVTITTGWTGSGTITTTIATASGTVPGTVVVDVPYSYVTTTTPWTGSGTTTTTISASGTVPGTVIVETPPCQTGLQWAFYNFTYNASNVTTQGPGLVPFDDVANTNVPFASVFDVASSLSGQTPNHVGNTTLLGLPYACSANSDDYPIYDYNTGTSDAYNVVEWTAYFRPSQTGDYTFDITKADDAMYLWFGDAAINDFNYGNSAVTVSTGLTPAETATYTYTVTTAGEYIPFRALLVNAQGCTAFLITVTDPSGDTVIGTTANDDGEFVSYCNDSVDIEAFPAWEVST